MKVVPNPFDTELKLFSESDYANFRGQSIHTIRNERSAGQGPPFIKIGRTVKYPLDGMRQHIAANTVVPSNAPTLINARRKRGGRGARS